jgi:hypothetical protein
MPEPISFKLGMYVMAPDPTPAVEEIGKAIAVKGRGGLIEL